MSVCRAAEKGRVYVRRSVPRGELLEGDCQHDDAKREREDTAEKDRAANPVEYGDE